MPYSASNYEFLFDRTCEISPKNAFKVLRHDDVLYYRTKTIKSGPVLECEIYPVWNCQSENRKARERITPEAQRNQNEKNARKKLIRKINTNFTVEDLCVTLTYKGAPPDEKQARRDIRNYIRRVREYRKKQNLPQMKYIYVIEFNNDSGRKKRIHHHIIMSGIDRDKAEKLWGKGYANAKRLQVDEYGFEALARYIIKSPNGSKRWCASRNLKEPKITTADTKISKRQAEKLAVDVDVAAPVIFNKLFPNYRFNDCEIRRSAFVAGTYIYTRMHKSHRKARDG